MAWDCPHKKDDYCSKRNKKCEILAQGCVLRNKVKFIDDKKSDRKKNN
jgi:hypothetical protein